MILYIHIILWYIYIYIIIYYCYCYIYIYIWLYACLKRSHRWIPIFTASLIQAVAEMQESASGSEALRKPQSEICTNHPFGNGNHTSFKNGDLGDGLWHCFNYPHSWILMGKLWLWLRIWEVSYFQTSPLGKWLGLVSVTTCKLPSGNGLVWF